LFRMESSEVLEASLEANTAFISKALHEFLGDHSPILHSVQESLNQSINGYSDKIKSLEADLEQCRNKLGQCKKDLHGTTDTFKVMIAMKNAKIKELERQLEAAVPGIPDAVTDSSSPVGVVQARFTGAHRLMDDDSPMTSKSTKIAGVDWAVKIQRIHADSPSLFVGLIAISPDIPTSWSCSAIVSYHLLSQLNVELRHTRKPSFIVNFGNGMTCIGFPDFVSFKVLFDAKNGYVKDDSIVISIDVSLFPAA
ncbi:hypothetical protein PFISCL1PPCAC_20317, partial [Pristionchus fissidentatus]